MLFKVLGTTEVLDDDGGVVAMGGAQRRALVATLVLRANQPCAIDWLTTCLWGEDAPGQSSALHPAVSRLRRILEPAREAGAEPQVLTSVPGGYLLRASADDVDAAVFERLLSEAEQAIDAADALATLDRALALWQGPAYADIADRPFAQGEAVRLEGRRLDALELRLERLLELGRAAEVVSEAEALVAEHPLRERFWALRMLGLYRTGRQADALRAFGDLRRILVDELGIEPGRELRDLEVAILRQDPALDPTPSAAPMNAGAPPVPVPATLSVSHVPFVGRAYERDVLASAWKRAQVESRQVVLIGGEPGVGKTRLVAELARQVADEGGHVVVGRCDEGMAVPYQPFVEALRQFTDHVPDAHLRPSLGRYAGELVRLLPELADRVPRLPRPMRSDAETERYRLFDAVAAWLAAASADRPLLLVLDDLHWGPSPTLLLTRHLARSSEPLRVLVVATHRPTEAGHPVTSALASLARLDGVERVELGGLDESDVRALLEDTTLGIEGPDLDSVARAMRYETGGNPLFVNELVRHLADTAARRAGDDPMGLLGHGLPQGVRDVVTARLAGLSPEANLLLERAAVVGVDFDHRLLEAVSALRDDELDEALADALVAGLIEVVADASVRYRFIHAVVRSAVYDAIAPGRRARLHRVVAEALESLEAPAGLDFDALAEHWGRAGATQGHDKAVEYAIRAGRRAQSMLAYETAAARYAQALALLAGGSDPRRGELLLALGEAQAAAGEVSAAKATYHRAAAVAAEEGDADQLARAALGYGVAGVTASVVDHALVELLEQAVTSLPAIDSPLRVKVLARLGAELYFSHEVERRRSLAEEAVAMARRVGDAEALAFALSAYHYVLWGPDGLDERLAIAREISAVAALTGNTELILQGHRWSIIDLLEKGSIDQADRHIEQYVAIANELRQPLYLWWSRVFLAMRHLLAGRLDDASATAEEAWRIGRRSTDAAMQFFGIQSGFVLRERGHLDTLETAARALVLQFPAVPAWKCALAVFYGDVGRHADAQAIVDEMAVAGFEDLPADLGWLPAMANLSDVCADIEDHDRAEILYRLLLPYRDRNLVIGAAVACQGSVARPLGRLAALLGRWDEAEALFSQAIADNARMGAPGLVAHAQLHFARALRGRGKPADLDKADVLAAEAKVTAESLGLTALVDRVEQLVG